MVIKTNDGKRFAGRDAVGVASRMKDDHWHIEGLSKREYKEEVAGRVQQMTGAVIRLDADRGSSARSPAVTISNPGKFLQRVVE
jgi:hypothetical protein